MATYKQIVTDAQIVEALEKQFGLTVYYAQFSTETLDSYFFYYKESASRLENAQFFSEKLVIGYVSINQVNDLTYEIADLLEGLGLTIDGIEFDVIRLTDGKNYADVSYFNCFRRIRRDPGRIEMIRG